MQYRMLALDMDDTLLKSDLKIGEKNLEKILLAKSLGVKIVISTGRMFRSIIPYLKELELFDEPAIVYNGAMIKRLSDQKVLIHHPIPLHLAVEVARLVEKEGSQLNAYLNDYLYVREKTPEVLKYMERTGVDSKVVGPIGDFLAQSIKESPTKLLVIHYNLEEIERIKAELIKQFGEYLTITGSKPYFIEITARNISKGTALKELAGLYGLTADEVIAVGDGMNDMSMIKWAGLGVAVANAHPELKKEANYVTNSCDNDGVAHVIEKFIL